LAVNPQTYDDIKSTFGPHPLGSVWATMLWEMTWGLIDDHGFDPDFYNGSGGNNIALAIVTEALKLS
jgi:extracellular elastinolytic metalloproteinase